MLVYEVFEQLLCSSSTLTPGISRSKTLQTLRVSLEKLFKVRSDKQMNLQKREPRIIFRGVA